MIGDIKKFRFWCQKVIPLVYDNSLSYYEVLCKVVDYLNKVIEDMNEIPSYIDAKIEEALDDEHLKQLIEEVVANIESAISSNNEHDNTNSSADYNIGQLLWWNGKLYKVIRQIDAGDTFIVDTNIELVNFEDLFNNLVEGIKHDITPNDDGLNTTASQSWSIGDWLWLNDDLYKVIKNITQGNAYVFTGENANVEEMNVEDEFKTVAGMAETNAEHIGDLSSLVTEDKDNLVEAINEVSGEVNSVDTKIGDLENLETSDKSSVVNAINSAMSDIETALVITAPENFGAIGDGSTDDTEACQKAIEDAITNNKKLLFTRNYKVNTLYVNGSIEIDGGGTLYGQDLRYDSNTTELNDTNRCFGTLHPEYYHPNTIITIHDSDNNQTLVVDKVEDNVVYVEPHFYENASTSITTFAGGSTINIHTTIFEIVADNQFLGSDIVLDNINIRNINIVGSQSGYVADNFIILDGRYNGFIFAHSIKNSYIENINCKNCISNGMAIMGTCTNVHVVNNIIVNCHSDFETTSETECGVVFHWSQRFIGSAYTAKHCVIEGNIIDNCYDGIFLSACTYITIANNNVSNITFRGLMIYAGDNTYPNRNHVVDGNTFYNASGSGNVGVIYLSNTIQTIVSNNEIAGGANGLVIGIGNDCDICNNHFIGNTRSGVTIYNGYRNNIKGNYFVASGASNLGHIYIDKRDEGNSYITIEGNSYEGANTSGGAINIIKGSAIKILNEVLHGTPSYLVNANTVNVSAGDVLIMNCYVNSGVAASGQLSVLKYLGCVDSTNTLVENVT